MDLSKCTNCESWLAVHAGCYGAEYWIQCDNCKQRVTSTSEEMAKFYWNLLNSPYPIEGTALY